MGFLDFVIDLRGGDGFNERYVRYGKGNSRFGFWNNVLVVYVLKIWF